MVESEIKEGEKQLVRLTKEEMEKLDGELDQDGFLILKAGGFIDPNGYQFDKDGKDPLGGFYDEEGYYVAPQEAKQINEDGRSVLLRKYTKTEIESRGRGSYDDDGFYIIDADGSYYDPLGYYFDRDGFDSVGGQYDKNGYYIKPAQENFGGYGYDDLEDYDLDDEEDEQDQDGELEKQAVMQEHIMPAQLHVREQQKVDPNKNFIIRVNNFPDLYEEKNILKFLKKKIPEFTHSKLVMEKRPQRTGRGK